MKTGSKVMNDAQKEIRAIEDYLEELKQELKDNPTVKEIIDQAIQSERDDVIRKFATGEFVKTDLAEKFANEIRAEERERVLKIIESKQKDNPKDDCWLNWNETDFIHNGYNQALAEISNEIKGEK